MEIKLMIASHRGTLAAAGVPVAGPARAGHPGHRARSLPDGPADSKVGPGRPGTASKYVAAASDSDTAWKLRLLA